MKPSPLAAATQPPNARSSADPIIEVHGLSKNFGRQQALSNVTVTVPPGTIGLLGPNGAGKSTFIKCLLNLEMPTAGTAKVLGVDIRARNRASREKVGYSPEQDCQIPGMAGCEYVTYCGQLSGMSFRAARQRTHEILDLVGMGQERYRPVDTYSTGMKQRKEGMVSMSRRSGLSKSYTRFDPVRLQKSVGGLQPSSTTVSPVDGCGAPTTEARRLCDLADTARA